MWQETWAPPWLSPSFHEWPWEAPSPLRDRQIYDIEPGAGAAEIKHSPCLLEAHSPVREDSISRWNKELFNSG